MRVLLAESQQLLARPVAGTAIIDQYQLPAGVGLGPTDASASPIYLPMPKLGMMIVKVGSDRVFIGSTGN